MDKGRKFAAVTDNLNKQLQKAMNSFSNEVDWIGLNNWLQGVEVQIRENPSPFIGDKITLSKRLSQCLNPVVPTKVHELALRIHEQMFSNMRNAVQGNINDYIKMFAEDLGLYSVGLIPFFEQTGSTEHRTTLLDIFNSYYMDLGKELIPLLPGMLISILPVHQETLDQQLRKLIEETLSNLLAATGRRYFVGSVWMCILRFDRCRAPGIKLLQRILPFMKFMAEEEELESSHGFSDEEEELKRLEDEALTGRKVSVRRSFGGMGKKKSSRFSTGKEKEKELHEQPKEIFESEPKTQPKQVSNQKIVEESQLEDEDEIDLLIKPTGTHDQSPIRKINLPLEVFDSSSAQSYDPIKLASHDKEVPPVEPPHPFHETDEQQLKSKPSYQGKMALQVQINSNYETPAKIQKSGPLDSAPLQSDKSGSIPASVIEENHFRAGPNFGTTPTPPEEIRKPEAAFNNEHEQIQTPNFAEVPVMPPSETQVNPSLPTHMPKPPANFSAPPPGWKPPANWQPPKLGTMPPMPPGWKPPVGLPLPGKLPPGFQPPPPGWKPPADWKPPTDWKTPPVAPLNPNMLVVPPSVSGSTSLTSPTQPPPLSKVPTTFPQPPPNSPSPFTPMPKSFSPNPPTKPQPTTTFPPPPGLDKFPSFQADPKLKPPLQPTQPVSSGLAKPESDRSNNLIKPTATGENLKPGATNSAEPIKAGTVENKKSSSVELEVRRKKPIALDRVPYVMTPELEQIKDGINDDKQENNYPNENTLVLNALISCLEDSSPIVKRSALDFMYTHLRLKNRVFSEPDKKVLVEVVLNLYVKKELTITKRVNGWLFGKPDDENKYVITEKNEFVVGYIINGFQRILAREPTNETDCILPLKILQNFYMQHDHMVRATLSPIAICIIRYIFNFGTGKQYSQDIMKGGQRFFENIPSHYVLIFESLGDELIEGIDQNDDLKCFEVVKYIDFCYIRLMKHEFGYEELEYLTVVLEKLGQALLMLSEPGRDLTKYSYVKGIVLLCVNLIDRKDRLMIHLEEERKKRHEQYRTENAKLSSSLSLGLLEPIETSYLPREMVEYEQQMDNKEMQRQREFTVVASNIEKFYIKLGKVIRGTTTLHPYEETFKMTSLAITKIQRHLPKVGVTTLPSWFESIESGIKIMNPVISLSAIEAMIYCLTAENVHPVYSSYRQLIVAERNRKVGNDYQKHALEKLWSLLDYPHMHRKIIDLIVNFSRYFPYQFTEVVSKSFVTHNVPDKEASIQRFSHFWRLTGFKYKDLLQTNRQLSELNKVGLFVMLDFLEDDNPLVRHAAKNWLLESMSLFYRVLDPLFLELLEVGDNIYETPKGQQIINKRYDTKKVFSIFRRIRSILTNGGLSFLRYIYQTSISDSVEDSRSHYTNIEYPVITKPPQTSQPKEIDVAPVKEPVLSKAAREEQEATKPPTTIDKLTYMDLLIIISVKYIKGQAIESMGIEFHVGNSAVNASSVEFLESFLSYIDTPDLCERFINFIMEDLFKVLEQGIANREYIIQIQLLNLFKTIFFNSSFRLKGEVTAIRQMFAKVFTSPTFMPSLLRGLNTPFSYVRAQFISFISICVPLIADFLEPEQCTHCVKNILFSYYEIIKSVNMRSVRSTQEESPNLEDVPISLKRIFEMKERTIRQDRIIRFTDNLTEVAKTNEILAILHGVSAVLNYFFQLDKIDYKKIEFTFSNPYTIFDKIKYVVTLSLANSVKEEKLISKTVFLHNLETSESILKDIQPVFETILRSWPLSEQYIRIATYEFSEIGVKSFDFERFGKYNKVLASLITYVAQEKDSIWGKIISIMRPMFYKFPKEIVSIYVELWIRECPNLDSAGSYDSKDTAKTEFLMKIVETLIVNDFPLNILVSAFLETQVVENLKLHYQAKKKDERKGNVLEYEKAILESKLIYFVHVYFHYVHLNESNIQHDNLRTLWGLILKVIKPFYPSKNPNTNLWILEFLALCSKKYSPKEILSDEKFKSELHLMINEKLKFVSGIASKQFNFFYEEPRLEMRGGDAGGNPLDSMSYRIILPFTPSIYQLYLDRKKKEFKQSTINLELFTPIRPGANEQIERRNRFYSFKTLKRLGLELIQNTYLPEKNQWIIKRTKEWIDIILPVIQNKDPENMVFAESASEVLHDLFDKARSFFLKSLKPDLLKIFNKDDFFICNVNTLKYWMRIIDWVSTADKTYETFRQYLKLVDLSTSYFSNQDADNKKRVKSFERICFLLYSGSKDMYARELKTLLPKISGIFKSSETAHPALLILILFSIRILIMRLSEKNLSELFTDIWPMIMTLLIQLFSRKLVKVVMSNEISKNPNLLLAALKLIEMMSITKLIQFSNNQWIFIHDYFGVQMKVGDNNIELIEYLSERPELKGILEVEKGASGPSPFLYKPYLSNYFPANSIDYIPKHCEIQATSKPLKRKLIIKQHKVDDENGLRVRAILLCQYLIDINELRVEPDPEEVDMLIVNDFINLDHFIHKL